jgi:glutathione synthase/RimK-type ligase-like ATP-grasp enzyme
MVIRWGCTANVPVRNVLNTAQAIHEVNDKLGFRRKLNEAELSPKTWFDVMGVPPEARETQLVTRPSRHAQGRRLYISNSPRSLLYSVQQAGPNYYISELINKVAEYRVFIVQGRVACVAKKMPREDHAPAPGEPWNVATGNFIFDNVRWDEWPLRAVRVACEAFELSSLDFGGVDVMVDGEGKAYVLEINSAPSLTSPYRQQCMAKCFDYIVRNGKQRIPMIEERGGYRKFVHPAITERAQLV